MSENSEQKSKAKTRTNPFSAIVSGAILTQRGVVSNLPYLLFLALLGIVYIANGYMAESSIRQVNRLQNEIKELRSEQISIKSELNNTIIESELKNIIHARALGLSESVEPPKKIVLSEKEYESINQ